VSRTWPEYAATWARLHGGYDPRTASVLVRGWLGLAYRIARPLAAVRVSPTAITAVGLLLSVLVPLCVLGGPVWSVAAAGCILLAALADTVDGALAVISDRYTRLGAVYDSIADRLGEATWLLAWWLLGVPGWLVVVCGAGSWLQEYVRARAAAVGMRSLGVVTVSERPTRILLAIFGLLLSALGGAVRADLAVVGVAIAAVGWAFLAGVGLMQVIVAVRRDLRGQPDDAAAPPH
jgi:CDP-diacylglycerol--glycerol-3-phosphate 3-phosphatidyltransferase